MATLHLYPLNDFAAKVTLKDVDPTTGKIIPLTTGTVTAFLATSSIPTATAADAALTTTCTHVGRGVWLIQFDAATLTAALLASLFGSTAPVLIVQQSSGFRTYAPVTYAASRPATVE